MLTLTAGVVVAVWTRPWSEHRGGRAHDADTAHPAALPTGTPKELLVPFPLSRRPVPGWHVNAREIGLPPRVATGSLFATSGEKAYFVTTHCDDDACSRPMGWVYGLDTRTGGRLFAPVAMTGFYGGQSDCYGNGPSVAVCVTGGFYKDRPQLAWVIDLARGAVTFTGPTQLYPQGHAGHEPAIAEVGNHQGQTRVVAAIRDKGIYGVGSHAELTWFLPGAGLAVTPNHLQIDDIPPMTLALQSRGSDRTGPMYRVFSAVDGKDLTPNPPAGMTIDKAAVYNGGFAYNYQQGASQGVVFYDTLGKEVARQEVGFASPMSNSALPIFVANPTSNPAFLVFTAAGKLLARIPSQSMSSEFRTIGTKLYVKTGLTGADESWQQWDLLTGNPGPNCKMQLGVSYVASDGNVIVYHDLTRYVAIDSSTCQTLWEIPSEREAPDHMVIWKVGNGLLGGGTANGDIVSLRPPD
ncbi:hypothetical protein A9W99_23175 [Mycobacterium sp. 1164966.3]|nr:hypothetical protein A9W99_23175 [Mycobacterium sp. 1164966.3]